MFTFSQHVHMENNPLNISCGKYIQDIQLNCLHSIVRREKEQNRNLSSELTILIMRILAQCTK